MLTTSVGPGPSSAGGADPDEGLSTRLRDLALVDIDALVAGTDDYSAMIGAYADDVHDALSEARRRIAALRAALGGPEPLAVLDATSRQRASDPAAAGAERVRTRLGGQAEAARALARLADLAGNLAPKLFEADRRRGTQS